MRFTASLAHAYRGLKEVITTEKNFQIELVFGLLALGGAWFFPLEAPERMTIILVVSFVLVLELLNSAIERLVDWHIPKLDALARMIKDIMAAAVLLASIFALAIGIFIFYPYIFQILATRF